MVEMLVFSVQHWIHKTCRAGPGLGLRSGPPRGRNLVQLGPKSRFLGPNVSPSRSQVVMLDRCWSCSLCCNRAPVASASLEAWPSGGTARGTLQRKRERYQSGRYLDCESLPFWSVDFSLGWNSYKTGASWGQLGATWVRVGLRLPMLTTDGADVVELSGRSGGLDDAAPICKTVPCTFWRPAQIEVRPSPRPKLYQSNGSLIRIDRRHS